jgi:hypothetical protein
MTLTFRLPFKADNMRTLKTLIKKRENKEFPQTMKRMIAKIMRIYCELGPILLRYTKHLISREQHANRLQEWKADGGGRDFWYASVEGKGVNKRLGKSTL